jgi:ABC-type spermidine/putrescine transport system permease subunit II
VNRRAISILLGRLLLTAVLLVMYAPVAMIFIYSFNESRIGSVWTGFSVRWYRELFTTGELWSGLRMSIVVGLVASTLSVSLGSLAAIGLKRWPLRARRAASGLLALPLVVPDMIIAVSLALFFHALAADQGLITVVLAHTAFGLSYAFVAMSGAVEDFDETLIDAAVDCGATPWQAFWRVTVPILAPSLLVAWLLVFALSFDDFLITFLTKGPGADTLPIEIFSRMRFGVQPDTNALFVVLFLLTLLGVLLAGWLSRRRGLLR